MPKTFHQFLTENQTDDQDDAISWYKSNSADTNLPLRAHKGNAPWITNQPHVRTLDQLTSRPIGKSLHVFRGYNKDYLNLDHMKSGDQFTDHGFHSTSSDRQIALKHAAREEDGTRHILHMHLPKNTRAYHMDAQRKGRHYEHEHEVLLPRGTRFELLHRTTENHHNIPHTVTHLKVVHQPDHQEEHAGQRAKEKAETDELMKQLFGETLEIAKYSA